MESAFNLWSRFKYRFRTCSFTRGDQRRIVTRHIPQVCPWTSLLTNDRLLQQTNAAALVELSLWFNCRTLHYWVAYDGHCAPIDIPLSTETLGQLKQLVAFHCLGSKRQHLVHQQCAKQLELHLAKHTIGLPICLLRITLDYAL